MENGSYQLSLVNELGFIRYGGTPEELRAAEILMREVQAAGGQGEFMEFTIPACDTAACTMAVTAPFQREVACVPYAHSGSVDGELPLFYAEGGTKEDYRDLDDLSGYAVLLDHLDFDVYKLLVEKRAAAFITYSGKWFDTEETADLVPATLRYNWLELGKVPGFSIRARDAVALVRDGAKTLRLTLQQTEREAVSRDLLAVIPGTSRPQESIVLVAHYDSVLVGRGAWDNATGAATLLALYRHFVKNPARRTLRFIWCGSEEQGLWGSRKYVEKNRALVSSEVKFCFNFDMCGTVLGPNLVFITGGDDLKHFAEQYCREVGWTADLKHIVHSSDSAAFADCGIPALGLSRGTKAADFHSRHDLPDILSAAALYDMEVFASGIIGRFANAAALPVPTGMDEQRKKELDRFFQRDKLEAARKERETREKKAAEA